MMNIPGNIIRGAGSVVGGTVSAVASVAGVGRREVPGEITVKEKTTITVKETPNKDAQTTAGLSILTGYLTKKNEQGMWQKRFCCLVPHMFLYYYDNEYSDSPRGVIDLEYFTDVDMQGENVLRLSTSSRISSRPFFFQIDDPSVMSQWMASMHRDRYMVVRDERDAYQQLQDQFSGQMDFTTKMIEEYGVEKDRLTQEISKGEKLIEGLVGVFQKSFEILENSDEVKVSKTNLGEMGALFLTKLMEMKSIYESKLNSQSELSQKETDSLEEKIERLEKQLAAETHARRLLETQSLQEKRDLEIRLRDVASQLEKSNQNYQTVWGVKSVLEEKLSVTSEQKKVLIKEVKTLRKKVDEVGASNEQLRGVNDNLDHAIVELQKQLESQRIKYEALLAQATSATPTAEHPHIILEESEVTSDLVLNALKASSDAKQHKGYASSGADDEVANPESLTRSQTDSPHTRTGSRHGSIETLSTSILPPPPLPVDLDGNVIEWDPESRENMLQMDWLSPEQRHLLQDRMKEELPFSHGESTGKKRSSIAEMTSNLFHSDKSAHTPGNAPPAPTSVDDPEHKSEPEEGKISFRRLSAMFHTSNNPSTPTTTPAISEPSVPANQVPVEVSPEAAAPAPPSSPQSNGAAIPTCYRCGGTIEGPKYSTCKCEIPQMTPIVEESAIDQFKGLFSKGKNAAKKAGSAVTSTLLKGKNDEIGTQSISDSQHRTGDSTKKKNLLSLDEWLPSSTPSVQTPSETPADPPTPSNETTQPSA